MSNAIAYNSILSQAETCRLEKLRDFDPNIICATTSLLLLNPDTWATCIPKLNDTGLASGTATSTVGGVFCVWDSVYNRCQSSCSWTVPANTTRANFQLWGAGGGSSGGCCCGGSLGGSTGEFISVVMDVTPGDVYTLATTCVACCFGMWGGASSGGCSSVTGPGITTLCAESGCASMCSWSCSIVNAEKNKSILGYVPTNASSSAGVYQSNAGYLTANNIVYLLQNPKHTACAGGCLCNSGYDYCTVNGCASCGEIPWIASHCTQSPTTISASKNPTCGWIPRRWNAMCVDSNQYGYVIYAPTVCFGPTGATTQKAPGSDCCTTFTSETCRGGCACSTVALGMAGAPFACMPGHGGVFTHIMGGSTCNPGDTGRGAAIRVTYC